MQDFICDSRKIIKIIEHAGWKSRKHSKRKWMKHKIDWLKDKKVELKYDEYMQIQQELISKAWQGHTNICFIIHRKERCQIIIHGNIEIKGIKLLNASLVFDLAAKCIYNLYRETFKEWQRRPGFVILLKAKND